ncbi:MAG: ABC transporter permease, partial [Candidatus Methanomethyliaceae archaeon]
EFTLGMAYIVAAMNVLYRDVSQMVGVLTLLWMYLSPVFYPISQIPEGIRKNFVYNAVGELVSMQTSLVLGGGAFQLSTLGIAAIISTAIFLLGVFVFRHLEPLFAEVM